ncbi:MAG: hypothetical protein R8K46_01810 [Mariprofundaceae bacterium]
MKRSILLHALSVNDRMLEPNDLPLHGRVWAYAKEEAGHDAFVGHCLTLLSLLGMQASDISWRKDIMAFDAEGKDGTYTVVISLADDSLASQHYYFLGLWKTQGAESSFRSSRPLPTDADLLQADLQFDVFFANTPIQMVEYGRLLDGELFGEHLYNGNYSLVSNANLISDDYARFVISPKNTAAAFPRAEVRHILYSLRNLMALTAAAIRIHKRLWASDEEITLYRNVMDLMRKSRMRDIKADEWDELVRDNGSALLQAAEFEALQAKTHARLEGLQALFDSILSELHSTRLAGMAPLWSRLQLPFAHAAALLHDRKSMLRRSEKQAELLLQMLHSRMLARQQRLLSILLEKG